MKTQNSSHKQASLKKVMGLIGPIFFKHRYRLLIGLIALLGVDCLQLTIPRILKNGIDGLSNDTAGRSDLLHLALLICLIGALATLFRFCWRYLIIGFSRHLERDLRGKIFHHVMSMDGTFFSRYSTGSIMALGANDLSAVQMASGMGLVAAIDALVMSVAAIFFMMLIDINLTLLALLPLPVLALATRILSGRLHDRFNQVQEQFSLMTEFARSSISSIRLLKAYTLERSQAERFTNLGQDYVNFSLRVAVIQGLLFPVATLVGSCGMLLVLYFGGRLVIMESITMGDFVAFITYLYMLIWPMMAIGWVANLSQKGITSLRRIYLLLATRSPLPGGNPDLHPADSSCTLHNLSFTYPNTEHKVLNGITLEIRPGILGITGPTGCGKTTLCHVLTRMYPVADTMYLMGTVDVNRMTPQSVQAEISYVGQEAVLFSDSIANNIGFGRPDADMELITQAARAAAIHDEILALPDGYESRVGERGVNLSGGQRQRVALARALLCERRILLIDDGLAAVDTSTEQEILNNIRPLLEGKTVIWISQRVKQLARADKILVLKQGRIDDLGSFDKLAHRNDFLRKISRRQGLHQTDRDELPAGIQG